MESLSDLRGNSRDPAFTFVYQAGSALHYYQGLLECGRCSWRLRVKYGNETQPGHEYVCNRAAVEFGEKVCGFIEGRELDNSILRQLLSALENPPVEVLQLALEGAEKADEIRISQIDAQRERLEHELRLARDRYHHADARYPLVFKQAQAELEDSMQAVVEFNTKIGDEIPLYEGITRGSQQRLSALVSRICQFFGLILRWRTTNEKKS